MENELLMSLLPTWHSLSPAMEIQAPEISGPDGADQFPGCFLTPFWEKSAESSGGLVLDSASSSLASSHVSPPNTSTDGFLIRELIGKLGNSGELSPQSSKSDHLYEENDATLRHSTSPMHSGFPNLSPAATRLSSHATRSSNGCSGRFGELAAMGKVMSRVSSSPALKPVGSLISSQASQDQAELSNFPEESSVSDPEKVPGPENWRRRKAATKGKEAGVEGGPGSKRAKRSHGGSGNGSAHAKAEDEAGGGGGGDGEDEKLQAKRPPEPPKDYVHVRARRGQATDSHSLAERVRRVKISERMKILQDLVPGCNKVTGKALVLDEIINYVQSLQCQVKFLSMKLSSFTAGTDIDTNDPIAKDVLQSESSAPSPSQMLQLGSFSTLAVLYGPKAKTQQYSMAPSNDEQSLPYQVFLGDDLHSVVQMGFGQN